MITALKNFPDLSDKVAEVFAALAREGEVIECSRHGQECSFTNKPLHIVSKYIELTVQIYVAPFSEGREHKNVTLQ